MKSIKVLDLATELKEHYGFALFDSIFNLLHFDPHKQHETFKRLIIVALQDYAKFYPLRRFLDHVQIKGRYKFHSNFDAWLKGQKDKERFKKLEIKYKDYKVKPEEYKEAKKLASRAIDERYIRLLPRGIYWVRNYLGVNAQWWKYDPELYEINIRLWWSGAYISYFADYPYVINFAPDGKITEDSRIYFLDINEDQYFITFLAYHLFKHVRNLNTSINLNQPVQFLGNIDTLISELQEQYNDIIESRFTIYETWRK